MLENFGVVLLTIAVIYIVEWVRRKKTLLAAFKRMLRDIIANNGFIPDQESFDLVQKIVPWPAVEVCLMNERGELLLEMRHFKEWPGKWGNIHDWYIPGGYMKTGKTMEEWCQHHLAKDGIIADIELVDTCGVIKWAPGEHPVGFPVSIACVCIARGEITFKAGTDAGFVNRVVPTTVPNHTRLQDMFFFWRIQNIERLRGWGIRI